MMKTKTKYQISVDVTKIVYEKLERLAKKYNISKNELAQWFLTYGLESDEDISQESLARIYSENKLFKKFDLSLTRWLKKQKNENNVIRLPRLDRFPKKF